MTIELSSDASDFLRQRLATGLYSSEEDVVVQGLRLLVDQEEAIAGIRRGLESLERGEGLSLDEAFNEIQRRHPLAEPS
jgi:putative addiction module CopG family antidote